MMKGKRIAIVVRGPGGAAAAIALNKAGYHVRMFAPAPAPVACCSQPFGFARRMGDIIHRTPSPFAWLLDAERMSLSLKDLHV